MKFCAGGMLCVILLTFAVSSAHAKEAWACGYIEVGAPGTGARSSLFEIQKNNLIETRAARGSSKPISVSYGISENNALFLVATHSAFSMNGGPGDSPDASVVIIDKDKGGIWFFDLSTGRRMETPPMGKCIKQ